MINSLHPTEVTKNEFYSIVSSLASKSSSGFDGSSVKYLKFIFPFISTVLLKIVNKSFTSGIFPDFLKIARISLHKGGDPSDLINFRIISLLSSISKVFERAMFNKMLSFIDKYHILSDCQFWFRKNHNTAMAILHALNFIVKLFNGKTPVIGLFVNISKAFDSIDYTVLLDKFSMLGLRGNCHSWLSKYLSNRFQYVEIAGTKSNIHKLSKGVLQGSILRPLLFLLYINDLASVLPKPRFTLFANDPTVLFSDVSLKTSLTVASNELRIVFEWFVSNKLCLNVNKTHFLLFATGLCCSDTSLVCYNCEVKKVQSTKFLGLFIDDNLCWFDYTAFLNTKLSKSFGLLKAVNLYMPKIVLLSIFYAFFHSQLHYGFLIWGNTYLSYLEPIKVLYKRCIRLLSCAHLFAHTPLLASQFGLLIFDDLFPLYSAVFMFKLTNNLLPLVITCMFVCLSGKTSRNVCDYLYLEFNLMCVRNLFFFWCSIMVAIAK